MSEVISFIGYTPPARFDDNPWTGAEVEEADAEDGDWELIDTLTFDEPDADPANPAARNLTTSNGTAPDLWYRLIFLDDFGGTSEPTRAFQNTEAPPAGTFANSDDLATRLGLALTPEERDRADSLLAIASDLIRDEVKCGQLTLLTETIQLRGTSDESIELPSTPVVSVASVTLDGEPLVEGSDWYLDGNMIVRLPVSRAVILDGLADAQAAFPLGTASFGWPEQTLEITYTHGYAEIPGKVRAICMEMVVRAWVNPGSVARETIGDTSTVYDNMRFSPAGLLLTDDEQKSLKRLFGAPAKSVAIGR